MTIPSMPLFLEKALLQEYNLLRSQHDRTVYDIVLVTTMLESPEARTTPTFSAVSREAQTDLVRREALNLQNLGPTNARLVALRNLQSVLCAFLTEYIEQLGQLEKSHPELNPNG
jgi:hypothetical protein